MSSSSKTQKLEFALALLACSALMSAEAPAQEKPATDRPAAKAKRTRVRAIVVDAAGKPVEGARITFVGRLMPQIDLGDLDLQRATSDERGRARAQLRDDRSYSAWAVWKDDKGKGKISRTAEEVGGGMVVRLVEAEKQPGPQRVDLRGIKSWTRLGPLAGRVRLGTKTAFYLPVAINEKGRAEIPPIPLDQWGYFGVELLGKDGNPLAGGRTKAQKRRVFPVPPPVDQIVEVTDKDGKPIEGVEAWVESGYSNWGSEGLRGKTDAQGRVEVAVATSKLIRGLHYRMRFTKAGYQDIYAGTNWSGAYANQKKRDKKPPKVWKLVMPKAVPMKGRLIGKDGKGIANARLIASSNSYVMLSKSSWSSQPVPAMRELSDDKGNFVFERMPVDQRAVGLWVLLPEEGFSRFVPKLDGWPMPPRVLTLRLPKQRAGKTGFGDFDLTAMRLARIRVIGPDGQPSSGAKVRIWQGKWNAISLNYGASALPSDRRGRVSRLLRTGATNLAAWHPETGYAFVELDADRDLSEPIDIKLGPFLRGRGRILDAAGKPVEGATLTNSGWSSSGSPKFGSFAGDINAQLLHAKSDANGRFEFSFVGVAGVRRHMSFTKGKARSERFELTTESIEDLELRLNQ